MKNLIFTIGLLSGTVAFAQQTPKTDSTKVQDIKEVAITKKSIQKKADRLIYDVAATPVAKGNTAFNILKETPLVSSNDDKTLKIAGKGNAVIYINGRKTQMNADALEAFLKNTPAENIQKIEVITLPGSEFNVESTDGVINILLKKKMTDGTNGNLRMSNTQAKYNSQSASASLNYRKGKFGASANISASDYIRIQDYTLANGNATENNISKGTVQNEDRDLGGYINLDYALTDKQNLGLSYNTWYSKAPYQVSDFFNIVTTTDAAGNILKNYNRSLNAGTNSDQNHSANLNYELKLDDKGSKLNLNAAVLKYHKKKDISNVTNIVTAQNIFLENHLPLKQKMY